MFSGLFLSFQPSKRGIIPLKQVVKIGIILLKQASKTGIIPLKQGAKTGIIPKNIIQKCLIREKVVTFRMVKLNLLLSIFCITK